MASGDLSNFSMIPCWAKNRDTDWIWSTFPLEYVEEIYENDERTFSIKYIDVCIVGEIRKTWEEVILDPERYENELWISTL